MAKGAPGADSSIGVNNLINGKNLIEAATAFYGKKPFFCDRYFTSTSTGGAVEYRHLKENRILSENGVAVLPIARQTKNVKGAQSDGSSDAEDNAEDIITTFGADYLASMGGQFYVFLDVEGSPSLSKGLLHGMGANLRLA
jgi:hypothetical protein